MFLPSPSLIIKLPVETITMVVIVHSIRITVAVKTTTTTIGIVTGTRKTTIETVAKENQKVPWWLPGPAVAVFRVTSHRGTQNDQSA